MLHHKDTLSHKYYSHSLMDAWDMGHGTTQPWAALYMESAQQSWKVQSCSMGENEKGSRNVKKKKKLLPHPIVITKR